MSTQEVMAKERWATEEAFIKGNVDALDEVFDPNCVFHSAPLLPSYDLQTMKITALNLVEGLSNIHWTWEEIIIKGNTAVQRFTLHGKHTGIIPDMPAPPTGQELTLSGCTVYHLKNRKIVEFTEYNDWLSWFQQLGIVPQLGQK